MSVCRPSFRNRARSRRKSDFNWQKSNQVIFKCTVICKGNIAGVCLVVIGTIMELHIRELVLWVGIWVVVVVVVVVDMVVVVVVSLVVG